MARKSQNSQIKQKQVLEHAMLMNRAGPLLLDPAVCDLHASKFMSAYHVTFPHNFCLTIVMMNMNVTIGFSINKTLLYN